MYAVAIVRGIGSWTCLLVTLIVWGCGDDDSVVPFEEIPPDKKLVELDAAELTGACRWAASLARQKLPPAGTKLSCDGIEITLNAPSCLSVGRDCDATVAEWEQCLPNVLDRLGDDPCLILEIAFPSELAEFIETTPNCEGLGPCGTVVR
jgi:hypothetical protein